MKQQIGEIVKIIKSVSGQYSPHQVFSDWVCMMALSIANSCTLHRNKVYQDREDTFKLVASKYSETDYEKLAEATAYLIEEMEEPRDVLGEIYMGGGFGSKSAGQFFTPFHLSEVMAELVYGKNLIRANNGKYPMHEPSCGAGGMIIALANIMRRDGINYQRELEVIAQDLDWNCVYMCYVQLSLMGISAVVVQGNTLGEPYSKETPESRVLYTPKKRGVLI